MTTKNHHFFLLQVNPWPFMLSLISFNLLFSLLIFFKYYNFNSFLFSFFFLFMSSFFWWMEFSGEMNLEGKNSFFLESGIKFAMLLFISSEIFFFFSFFWGYFHYFLSPSMEVGLSWPPTNLLSFDFLNVPLINTLILLSSGVTVTISHFFLIEGSKNFFKVFLFYTISLGVFFTFLQILEYSSSFFSISDGNFGTSFFILTGFHGIHVLIGTMFLLVVLIRSLKMISSQSSFISFELASWYWHFVDVVWIFLYFFLYYMTKF